MIHFSLSAFLRGASQLLDVTGIGARRGARDSNEAALRALRSAWQTNAQALRTVVDKEKATLQGGRPRASSSSTKRPDASDTNEWLRQRPDLRKERAVQSELET